MPGLASAAPLAPRSLTASSDALGEVALLAPAAEPDLFVFLISDRDGVNDTTRAEAAALVEKGAAVALIDLPDLVKRFAASGDADCHYMFGALEDFNRVAERTLGMTTWRWPVLLGAGDGGTLAYLALAQAPANTAAGAVSIGVSPQLATKLPLCAGAPEASSADGVITYTPQPKLPGPWTVIEADAPTADLAGFIAGSHGKVEVVAGDADARFAAAVDATLAIGGGPTDPLSDLPIVELPADAPVAFAVFLSGDGGWRDLDKHIGEYLSKHHVSVIGLDSLRYFWSKKSPEQVATDIDRIVEHYRKAWSLNEVALLGYSLGADALPPAWPHLSPTTQGGTVFIGLLGTAPAAALEVSVSGWLGITPSDAIDMRPYLADLPADRVACVYGKEEFKERDTACVLPELGDATRIERPGGHHFDGNYDLIGQMFLERITGEAAKAPGQ